MTRLKPRLLASLFGAAVLTAPAVQAATTPIQHVILISIDGMHAIDLTNFINANPTSTLAGLSAHAVIYPNAFTTAPSDSFPGMLALATGGTPKSTGVFYDDSFDRTYFAPNSNCAGAPGAEVTYAENIDVDSTVPNAGGKLGQPLTQIDPAKLPQALVSGFCTNMLPHTFVRVNTIFEVIKAAGMTTAWADKHPAYEILNGPSGAGVDDLFAPEINSLVPGQSVDNTHSYVGTQNNDLLKVKAVINEIRGLTSTGKHSVGVPAIMGMNFQSVSVGQKLAIGLPGVDPANLAGSTVVGGYKDSAATPNDALLFQLAFVDGQLRRIVHALGAAQLAQTTAIIITAKHGQSPIDPTLRRAIDDTPYSTIPGNGFHIADDAALIWLAPASRAANLPAALKFLRTNAASLGIAQVLGEDSLRTIYQDPARDSRTPDFVAVADHGVIYTTGTKLAEHGGFADDDRNVALMVTAPHLHAIIDETLVETRQVAPTILHLLGIDPKQLQAVPLERTAVLPNIVFH